MEIGIPFYTLLSQNGLSVYSIFAHVYAHLDDVCFSGFVMNPY